MKSLLITIAIVLSASMAHAAKRNLYRITIDGNNGGCLAIEKLHRVGAANCEILKRMNEENDASNENLTSKHIQGDRTYVCSELDERSMNEDSPSCKKPKRVGGAG